MTKQTIFFQGWSLPDQLITRSIRHIPDIEGNDIVVLNSSNYESAVTDLIEILYTQEETVLIGYSFGFTNLMDMVDLIPSALHQKLRIYGICTSPLAVNDLYGIPIKNVEETKTIWQSQDSNFDKRRIDFLESCMYPVAVQDEHLELYLKEDPILQYKDLNRMIKSEKHQLYLFTRYMPLWKKTQFIAGSKDRIFPIRNLKRIAQDYNLKFDIQNTGHLEL